MASRKRSISGFTETKSFHKEWDDALCPICMDHPHNVVKLLCSSHDKGCRPYICDTSYRHSNCLDRFKNLISDNTNYPPLPSPSHDNSNNNNNSKLKCPLCRGTVLGWKIDEEARTYLNLKRRSCSCENCSFFGNYIELRKHARRDHPTARPSNIDPSRQQAWRSIEHEREYEDIVSAIRSAMPGAVVLGDFVVEEGERETLMDVRERGLTTYLLFEMISGDSSSTRSRARRSRRRYLWGENLLGLRNEYVDVDNEGDEDLSPIPRRRRRFTRSISDEDQS